MIDSMVAMIDGKGGTGKTPVVANVAGLAAAAGYQVLGARRQPRPSGQPRSRPRLRTTRGDTLSGASLLAALAGHAPLTPLRGVRPGLGVTHGGEEPEDWAALASSWRARGRVPEGALDRALGALASRYNLILLDCPPGNRELQLLAMHAAHHALIPTKPDEASLDRMIRMARLFESVRVDNPALQLLGVLLFGIENRTRRVCIETRDQIACELGDADLVFTAEVRHILAPARDARGRGQLAHEYEGIVLAAPRFYQSVGRDERLAASAPGLADDYQAVTRELLTHIQTTTYQGVPA